MAEYFNIGDIKTRPNTYFNIDKKGEDDSFGAVDGVVALTIKASFGPLNKAMVVGREDGYEQVYGSGGTTDAIKEAFYGGAKKAIVCRVGGTDGKEAAAQLTTGTGNITIKARHVGAMKLSATVRVKLTDATKKECIIYNENEIYEKVTFDVAEEEVTNLKKAFANSKNFIVEGEGTGTVNPVEQKTFDGGKDPTVVTKDYVKAFTELEKHYFNSICVDTEEAAVHALLAEFLNRIFAESKFGTGFVAEKGSKDLADRMNAAKVFDNEKMAYILNSKVPVNEMVLEGYQTAAYLAGLYAATPSNKSLTHTVIKRYTGLEEQLTNSQIEKAERNGCLVLSLNSDGEVWIDSAINTLINPPENMDEGWKKLRRVKTRHELLYRANSQADALVGRVDNDVNGRAIIIGKLQKIINDMVNEGKLVAGTVAENVAYPADKDYCYFDLNVIDKDSAERIFLLYKFQFSTVEE